MSGASLISRSSGQRRALIIDKRAVMGTEICRSLARRGYAVDIVGDASSPAFRSRFCARRFIAPPFSRSESYKSAIIEVVNHNRYSGILICNEEALESLMTIPDYTRWPGLVLAAPQSLRAALSKFAMMRIAEEAGVSTPRSLHVKDECDLAIAGGDFGFPLIIKGDRGESGNHVRIVTGAPELSRAYREIVTLEHVNGDQGVLLQEFVAGTGYSVGGLFHQGRPLRVCAHRKLVGVPPLGGLTVRGITERPQGLLEQAFRIFEALEYTGLGHVEFIRDESGRFRFLEINPRVWGTIGVGEYAGVDFFTPYVAIADGAIPEPDLRFSEGVTFHRIGREGKMMRVRPSRIAGFLCDCFDPRVRSDFEWFDPLPHLTAFAARGLGFSSAGKRAGASPSSRPQSSTSRSPGA